MGKQVDVRGLSSMSFGDKHCKDEMEGHLLNPDSVEGCTDEK